LCAEPEVYRARYAERDKDPSVLDAVPWWLVDAGAALMGTLLAAADEGLGAGFLGGHALTGVTGILGVPHGVDVVGIVTLGPPADDRRSSSLDRAPRTGRVHRDHW
ncbi:MAG TPA: nitroreductase family protein, partial [Acidimicrobiia bacterium]|nr:nitroreductase family protein [Acidimicrobiia bacterium]